MFQFSPMQCAGDNFAYKLVGEETLSSEGSDCKILPFPYDMACYAVHRAPISNSSSSELTLEIYKFFSAPYSLGSPLIFATRYVLESS